MNDSGESIELAEVAPWNRGPRVTFTIDQPPDIGSPVHVAPGVWLLRLPYEGTMDHVNAYILQDDCGLTLVDTGPNSVACHDAFERAMSESNLLGQNITRVIATHFHPDHLGLVGHFCQQGAELVTTRTCWLAANLLQSTARETPCQEHVDFVVRAGMSEMELEAFLRRRPSSYPDQVVQLPQAYRTINDGNMLTIGERDWQIRLSGGHCSDQLTMWSGDEIAIVADQILPHVSPSLAVHYTEPYADNVTQWLSHCRRFARIASNDTLCLPGHGRPFRGAPARCEQLIGNCVAALDRLLKALSKPMTAMDCLEVVYRRELRGSQRLILIGEVVGYLNHLQAHGLISAKATRSGTLMWRRCSSVSSYDWTM